MTVKVIDGKKKCSKCGKEKFIEEFNKQRGAKSGLMSQCKDCRHTSYYLPNREKIRKRVRDWRRKNHERAKETQRDWYRKNRAKCASYSKKYWHKIKLKVFIHYGTNPPKCACCGETILVFLTIDHIEGGGLEHRRKIGPSARGHSFYNWLIRNNFPEGFQVLCYNCNCGRVHNNGICPHKERK